MIVKSAILGYAGMLAFFYSCDIRAGCLSVPEFWPYYYSIDHVVKGGPLLWWIAYKYTDKYKLPALLTFWFSLVRCVWLIACYLTGVNPSNTYWTIVLFFCLMPVILFTVLAPESRLTRTLCEALKLNN